MFHEQLFLDRTVPHAQKISPFEFCVKGGVTGLTCASHRREYPIPCAFPVNLVSKLMLTSWKTSAILISIETFEYLFPKDKRMLSDQEIENSKKTAKIDIEVANFEHNDCIRIAYAWLDAQKKTKTPGRTAHSLKHMIEKWAGRYVSRSDVEVAAHMHPEIKGEYPYFNISARLIEPNKARLEHIGEAFTQRQHRDFDPSDYKTRE